MNASSVCRVVVLTLSLASTMMGSEQEERARLEKQFAELNQAASKLQGQGQHARALEKLKLAHALCLRLYPEDRFPGGHPQLASALNRIGFVLHAHGEHARAVEQFREALAMRQRLYPSDKYPRGHLEVAMSLNNLSAALNSLGMYPESAAQCRLALRMFQKLYPQEEYPQGHSLIAISHGNLAQALHTQGELAAAREQCRSSVAMLEKLYPHGRFPQGHPDLARGLTLQATMASSEGEYVEAVRYYRLALAMLERLYPGDRYPQGHPDLARALCSLGTGLYQRGELSGAAEKFRQALALRRSLYPVDRFPHGHPELATSLHNLGSVAHARNDHAEAVRLHEQTVGMCRTIYSRDRYPRGHPDLANSSNSLGFSLQALGQHSRARAACEDALAMNRRLFPRELYPQGHLYLVRSMETLGRLLEGQHDHSTALSYYHQALEMHSRLCQQHAANASEAQGLAFLASRSPVRDAYLFSAARQPNTAVASYELIWQSKAQLGRLLHRRQQAIRLARIGSEKAEAQWTQLDQVRQQLSALLLRPVGEPALHARELERLTNDKERLERDLAKDLPPFHRGRELDQMRPEHLTQALPRDAAFIDFLRCQSPGKKGRVPPRYFAWILTAEQEARRIDLGDADLIDQAVASWRKRIEASSDTVEDADTVAKLVWQPVARHLPASAKTVYLAPDGELARLPWVALPAGKGATLLLEDYALALVPHGPFLLEQLKYHPTPAGSRSESVLALGDVEYGTSRKEPYPVLPGSKAELRQVAAVSGDRAMQVLTGRKATWEHLRKTLPGVGYAHLATHGFFDEPTLRAEKQRQRQFLERWEQGHTTLQPGLGVRSPLSYTGLVLAGANEGADHSVVTGESLIGLPLEGLRLCVLSACQTGLGELGVGGEGVQGLPRALHLAGCPNVIGSLWRVDDQATAALMAKLYQQLWHEGKRPIEALRQAQLTVLRHPDLVATLADRGKPDFEKTVQLDPGKLAALEARAGKRTRTRLWAAFVLSGVGE